MLGGCNNTEKTDEENQYSDEQFITAMSDGLQARWTLNTNDEGKEGYADIQFNSEEYKEMMLSYIDAELEHIEGYKDEKYEDSKLQEIVIRYINLLNEHKEICSYMTVDYDKYYSEFEPIYNERSKIIADLVENYNLTVDEEYKSTLDDFLTNSQLVVEQENLDAEIEAMISGVEFVEVADDGYSFKTYQAVVENTTSTDFKNFSVSINLLNEEGVIVSTEYSSVTNFTQGAKVQFEFMTDKAFVTTQINMDWWD